MSFAVGDRFALRGVIGRGGMGVVYAAYDHERESLVALKTISRISAGALLRFKREFRALADVHHHNLVTLHELSEYAGDWYFTMELLRGVSIVEYARGAALDPNADPVGSALQSGMISAGDDYTAETVLSDGSLIERSDEGLRVDRPPPPDKLPPIPAEERVRAAFLQLVDGVHALHASGHLHRDIKPSNTVVTPEGRVVLLDFGVVADLHEQATPAFQTTAGTPAYMAPEQADGTATVSAACDWYAVGIMLYEVLAGRRPFYGTATEVLSAKRTREPELAPAQRSGIPAELAQLACRLLSINPSVRPGAEEIRSVLRRGERRRRPRTTRIPRARGPLIGRDSELATMRAAYAAVRAGEGLTLYVSGRSGMGKSSLIQELLEEVRTEPTAVVLQGRCYQQESVPYKAIDGVIDALCVYLLSADVDTIEQLVQPDVAMLARLFPVLGRVEAIARATAKAPKTPDPHEVKRRAFSALRGLLTRLGASRPVVLFIDDLQWGDLESGPLIENLMRGPDQPPILLLASFRSEERLRSRLLRALLPQDHNLSATTGTIRELQIEALNAEASLQLARSLATDDTAEVDLAEVIRDAGGHPYFICELVGHAGADPNDTTEALTLDGVIAHRAKQLENEARLVAELVAVAGQPISQACAQRAGKLSAAMMHEIVRQLHDQRFLHASGLTAADTVEPFHDRIRETLVVLLDEQTLRAHHAALATALAQDGADDDLLVGHYRAAGDASSAAHHAIRAGNQAAATLAFEQAAQHYAYAISIVGSDSADGMSALQIKLAESLAHAGRCFESAEAYGQAIADADGVVAQELQRRMALEYLRSGHIDEGLQAISSVIASLGMKLPSSGRGSVLSLLWHRAQLRLRGLRFTPRDESEIVPAELTRIDICWSVAIGLAMVDTYRCADFQTRNVLFALRAGERARVARALSLEIGFASLEGWKVRDRALEIVAEAGRLAEQVGDPAQRAWVDGAAALCDYQVGMFSTAKAHAERAVAVWRTQCTGVSWEVSSAELYRLWSLFYMGRFRELHAAIQDALQEARLRGDLFTVTSICSGVLNLTWILSGRADEGLQLLDDALANWSRTGFHLQHYWEQLARAHHDLYRDDPAAAYARMTQLIRDLRRAMMLRIQCARTEAVHLRARCALALYATDNSRRDCLRRAEKDAKRLIGDHSAMALCFSHLLRAGAASLTGDPDRACEHLHEGEQAALEADMAFYATAARRRRGQLVGGEHGQALVAEADAWMEREGIVDVDRIVGIFVPS